MVMFGVPCENKITKVGVTDLMMVSGENSNSPVSTSIINARAETSIDLKALSLNIILLKLKKTFINKLSSLSNVPNFESEERKNDVKFLIKKINIIDRHLKNVLLKLRLRFEREFGAFIRTRKHKKEL